MILHIRGWQLIHAGIVVDTQIWMQKVTRGAQAFCAIE